MSGVPDQQLDDASGRSTSTYFLYASPRSECVVDLWSRSQNSKSLGIFLVKIAADRSTNPSLFVAVLVGPPHQNHKQAGPDQPEALLNFFLLPFRVSYY